jgi:hypothetical protein
VGPNPSIQWWKHWIKRERINQRGQGRICVPQKFTRQLIQNVWRK